MHGEDEGRGGVEDAEEPPLGLRVRDRARLRRRTIEPRAAARAEARLGRDGQTAIRTSRDRSRPRVEPPLPAPRAPYTRGAAAAGWRRLVPVYGPYLRLFAFRNWSATFSAGFLLIPTARFIAAMASTVRRRLTLLIVDVNLAPCCADEVTVDDRRDVLEPEHVLRVPQLHVLPPEQLRVGREHVRREHVALVEELVRGDPCERDELEPANAVPAADRPSPAPLPLREAGDREVRHPPADRRSVFEVVSVRSRPGHGDHVAVLERRLTQQRLTTPAVQPLREQVRPPGGPRRAPSA